MERILGLLLLLAYSSSAAAQKQVTPPNIEKSFVHFCPTKPWVRIAASTVRRDAIPPVTLLVTDPKDHKTGFGSKSAIPKSHYGNIVTIAGHPEISKALAIEVCEPLEGQYELMVVEQKGGAAYEVTISGADGNGIYTVAMIGLVRAAGRTCHYAFRVITTGTSGGMNIVWVDEAGPTSTPPTCVSQPGFRP